MTIPSPKLTRESIEEERAFLLNLARIRVRGSLQRLVSQSDLVQQTMLQACSRWETFEGESVECLRGWLSAILHRQYLQSIEFYVGSQKRTLKRDVAATAETIDECSLTSSAIVVAKEDIESLLKSIEKLPPDLRVVITLRHIEQKTFTDIGNQLGISRHAVYRRWKSAINQLGLSISESTS